MVDNKTVVQQVQELQIIMHEIESEGMSINEPFQVAAVIEKLPPGWKDFKNYLKHKRKDMSLEDLIVRLRIEEDNRNSEKKATKAPRSYEAKANVVEEPRSKKRKNFSDGSKSNNNNNNNTSNKKAKFKGKCFNCDKLGHKSAECRGKKKNPKEANLVSGYNNLQKEMGDLNLVCMVSESNMVSNGREWFVDTGATRHICAEKSMFSTYNKVTTGDQLFMGNSSTSCVEGKGNVVLKLTSGKELTLTNVLHVPEIRKNLISGSLLSKNGFRLVFESDKFVLTKSGVYVGKGYLYEGLFKCNVLVIKPKASINEIKAIAGSSYLLEIFNMWHKRLGHVNYDSMRTLMKMDSIPRLRLSKDKCQTCVEAKQTRTSFPSVKRDTKPLDLIHTDLCDFKSIPSLGQKNYYITFIDDSTRYCHLYLLESKNEAFEAFKIYKNEVENQLERKIKVLKSDRGGEYVHPFADFCADHGIIHQTTAPYSPQSNGIA